MPAIKITDYLGAIQQSTKFDSTNIVDLAISEINDAGAVAAPDVISLTRGGFSFRFPAYNGSNTTEWKTYRVEIAHNVATELFEPHFRCTPIDDTAGDVKMIIEVVLQKKAGNTVAGVTKSKVLTISANSNTNETEYYFPFLITNADFPTIKKGDSLLINIKRNPSDVEDTYNNDVAQIEFGVHGFIDSTGEEY